MKLDLSDLQERKARMDHLGLLDILEDQEKRVIKVLKAEMGHLVSRVREERMDFKGNEDRQGLEDSEADLEDLEVKE